MENHLLTGKYSTAMIKHLKLRPFHTGQPMFCAITGSTSFYNASGDLLALQQMGTWSNSRMPQHYAKVMSSRAKSAIRKLEAEPRLKLVGNESDDLPS